MSEHTVGLVLLTRNTEEVGNKSPGYWNHVAVCVANQWVVEGQAEPGKVIAVPFPAFFARYPEIVAIRVLDRALDGRFADRAADQLGDRFRRIRNNCVAVAQEAVAVATGRRPKWRIPDDLYRDRVAEGWRKNDYENYQIPSEWFVGMTTNPRDLLESPKWKN